VLVAGVDPNSFCKYITTAITQSFSVNKNMTLAATISVPEQYSDDDIQRSLDKIKLNGRSSCCTVVHSLTSISGVPGDVSSQNVERENVPKFFLAKGICAYATVV